MVNKPHKTHHSKNGLGGEIKIATANVDTIRTYGAINSLLHNPEQNTCIRETHNGKQMLGNMQYIIYFTEVPPKTKLLK